MSTGPERLAAYVRRDRTRLYRSRQQFATAIGVSKRTVDRLEKAEPVAFRPRTLDRVESGLLWASGSIEDILNGGEPIYEHDKLLVELQRIWPQLDEQARTMLLALARQALHP